MDGQHNVNMLYQGFNVIDLCMNAYPPKTFEHCKRVANYVFNNIMVTYLTTDTDFEFQIRCYCFALCHDLLEDTEVTVEQIARAMELDTSVVEEVLFPLTQKEDESYVRYIRRLKNEGNIMSYIIKLADMKDHLSQKETLTDKLKEKYLNALPELL